MYRVYLTQHFRAESSPTYSRLPRREGDSMVGPILLNVAIETGKGVAKDKLSYTS